MCIWVVRLARPASGGCGVAKGMASPKPAVRAARGCYKGLHGAARGCAGPQQVIWPHLVDLLLVLARALAEIVGDLKRRHARPVVGHVPG